MLSHQYPIAQTEQVIKRINELEKRSIDLQTRLAQPLKKLWNPIRELATVENVEVFSNLYERFPNFREVIQFYEINALALKRLNEPYEAMPVLLQGDPGLGKTYFASELARVLGLKYYEISLATTTANFAISGSSGQWSEGSPGFIATSLIDSDIANPFILIDEIDKASLSTKYNPITPFYSLLEPHTAKRFKDEALEIELDTTKVIWLATSNYINQIPIPVQSRMRIFNIERPLPEDMPNVIKSIYQLIRNERIYSKFLNDELPDELIYCLLKKTPRQIRQSFIEGAMNAIRMNRDYIDISDLPNIEVKETHRVGFI